jgi:hypothetical protein
MSDTWIDFRKSSFSDANGGACVEVSFRKSSFSDNNGAQCVEIGHTLSAVRDSKNPIAMLVVDLRSLLTSLKLDR